jgi:hypothetical protein
LAQDGSERAFVEFAMVGYDYLSEGVVASKNDVTSVLALEYEVFLLQNCYNVASGNAG